MNQKKTRVVCIIDESGSMFPLAKDTIGGYNRFLQEQQADGNPSDTWTLITFNVGHQVICEDKIIGLAPKLDHQNYRPDGGTALLDAMGVALNSIGELDDDERVLCLVQTDGEENSSQQFNYAAIQKLVKEKEDTGQWTFVFMGANLDAFAQFSTVSANPVLPNTQSYSGQNTVGAWANTSRATRKFRHSAVSASVNFYQEAPAPDGMETANSNDPIAVSAPSTTAASESAPSTTAASDGSPDSTGDGDSNG